MALIIAVADTLDAMTTHRPYQSAMDLEEALQLIHKKAGTKFDVAVVDALDLVVKAGQIHLTTTASVVPV
jgi:HD-GYP domain-containing protein (c-di-GMP phosphodiesterase class II)